MVILRAVLLFSFCVLTSCSINSAGLPFFHKSENSSNRHNYRTDIKSFGFHLSTHSIDRGLSFGYVEKTYIVPKKGIGPDNLLQAEDYRQCDRGVKNFDDAIAYRSYNAGAALNFNRIKINLQLGLHAFYLLLVPKDYDGVFVLKNLNYLESNKIKETNE